MEWRDEGIVLAARAHGETSVILEVFTREHGRHLGVVHGGVSRKKAPMLQPGNQLDVTWRARLDSHMGTWTAELQRARSALLLSDPLRLSALTSAAALCSFILPQRESLPDFQPRTEGLFDALADGEGWLHDYVFWELSLLDVAGFGLDLTECAAGGGANDLAYVSPRTGRAVSRTAAGEWASRLLPMPDLLLGGMPTLDGVIAALEITGHFLTEKVAPALGERPLPAARTRLLDALRRER
ncbi:DNA repair protein RecO [Jannaschia pohangensis]|uniref:DNA repair protein RecO n=1 Tax=Jannaschia pohangensis TaxID=390807 RepID=UPI000B886CDD|nr:DNA repair protein RecO [Jannaschia pohangensis]